MRSCANAMALHVLDCDPAGAVHIGTRACARRHRLPVARGAPGRLSPRRPRRPGRARSRRRRFRSRSDALADTLLVDVRSVDSTIQVDARVRHGEQLHRRPSRVRGAARAAPARGGGGAGPGAAPAPERGPRPPGLRRLPAGPGHPGDGGLGRADRPAGAGGQRVHRAAEPAQHGGRGGPDPGGPGHRDRGADGDRRSTPSPRRPTPPTPRGGSRRYRQILVRAMESEGFTNYDQEWWHFSYPVEGAVPFDRVIH